MKDFGYKKIFDKEDPYHQRRLDRMLSPERSNPFATPGGEATKKSTGLLPAKRSYYDIMSEQTVENER